MLRKYFVLRSPCSNHVTLLLRVAPLALYCNNFSRRKFVANNSLRILLSAEFLSGFRRSSFALF